MVLIIHGKFGFNFHYCYLMHLTKDGHEVMQNDQLFVC